MSSEGLGNSTGLDISLKDLELKFGDGEKWDLTDLDISLEDLKQKSKEKKRLKGLDWDTVRLMRAFMGVNLEMDVVNPLTIVRKHGFTGLKCVLPADLLPPGSKGPKFETGLVLAWTFLQPGPGEISQIREEAERVRVLGVRAALDIDEIQELEPHKEDMMCANLIIERKKQPHLMHGHITHYIKNVTNYRDVIVVHQFLAGRRMLRCFNIGIFQPYENNHHEPHKGHCEFGRPNFQYTLAWQSMNTMPRWGPNISEVEFCKQFEALKGYTSLYHIEPESNLMSPMEEAGTSSDSKAMRAIKFPVGWGFERVFHMGGSELNINSNFQCSPHPLKILKGPLQSVVPKDRNLDLSADHSLLLSSWCSALPENIPINSEWTLNEVNMTDCTAEEATKLVRLAHIIINNGGEIGFQIPHVLLGPN